MKNSENNIDDNVIKNSEKNVNKEFKFIPEYIRLGVSPIPMLEGLPEEEFASYDDIVVETEPSGDVKETPNFPNNIAINAHTIDNNNYVDYVMPKSNNHKPDKKQPDVGEYILMLFGKIICIGNENDVLMEAKNILYGNHTDYKDIKVSDLVLLKRATLKVGVFIEQ